MTTPFASVMLEQGAAKVDWVTVWFFGKKTNLYTVRYNNKPVKKLATYVTVSPAAAVTEEGVKVKPDWPTITW